MVLKMCLYLLETLNMNREFMALKTLIYDVYEEKIRLKSKSTFNVI